MESGVHVPEPHTGRLLRLTAFDTNLGLLEDVLKALGSDKRLAILRFLGTHTCSVIEIAEALALPQSTANLHLNILEKAGLIKTDLQPAKRGLQKMCARVYDQVIIALPAEREAEDTTVEVSMPIGAYVDVSAAATCGLASEEGFIGHLDDPSAFYEPEHIRAQILWFRRGYVEYRFPNRLPRDAELDSLEVSFEVCSEAPLHHLDWPSDITVWINGSEAGTWTSPADFGGQRGALTPSWWDNENSQFGLLKVWRVTRQGGFVDGVRASGVTLNDLDLRPGHYIAVRIGIKDGARHSGGLNLFGSQFGNYAQDVVCKQRFRRAEARTHNASPGRRADGKRPDAVKAPPRRREEVRPSRT